MNIVATRSPSNPALTGSPQIRSPAAFVLMVSRWGMVLLSPYFPPAFGHVAAFRPIAAPNGRSLAGNQGDIRP